MTWKATLFETEAEKERKEKARKTAFTVPSEVTWTNIKELK